MQKNADEAKKDEAKKTEAKAKADATLNELTGGAESPETSPEVSVEAKQEELPINTLREPNAAYEALKQPEKKVDNGAKVFEEV